MFVWSFSFLFAVVRMVHVESAEDLRAFLTHPLISEFEDTEELEQVVAAFPPDFSIGVKKVTRASVSILRCKLLM